VFTGTLKPYQVEAVSRMVGEKKMLVAYEMGLGKTCMTIAALEKLNDTGQIQKGPILVIALSSLKYQWQKEIAKFTKGVETTVVDGNKQQRTQQYEDGQKSDYVITNYESIVNDWETVRRYFWGAIVCDEATAIKGFRSKRSKKVKDLSRNVSIRFALTGTPIENGKPEELYSIMQFVNPNLLGRFDLFDQTFIVRNHFGGVQRYRNLPIFHEKMKTSSVRKIQTDPDVAPYLPSVIYREPILVRFDSAGQKLYNFIAEELLNELVEAQQLLGAGFSLAAHYGEGYKPGSPADMLRGSIMSKITALRMVCDDPMILASSGSNYDGKTGSAYANYLWTNGHIKVRGMGNPKLDALKQYVNDHLETDPDAKVVVFTSYLGAVAAIHSELGGTIYTGEMNSKEKEKSKEKFLNDPDCRIFISSDAGGYGVDLPNANLLINYDLPWNAGLAVQRNGRIKRASSRWPTITIQDILMKGSIEERQFDMLQQKNAVADAVMDGQGINSRGGVDLTVGSLLNFISQTKVGGANGTSI
jgi:SNF2 family DNA or RNA helicase